MIRVEYSVTPSRIIPHFMRRIVSLISPPFPCHAHVQIRLFRTTSCNGAAPVATLFSGQPSLGAFQAHVLLAVGVAPVGDGYFLEVRAGHAHVMCDSVSGSVSLLARSYACAPSDSSSPLLELANYGPTRIGRPCTRCQCLDSRTSNLYNVFVPQIVQLGPMSRVIRFRRSPTSVPSPS